MLDRIIWIILNFIIRGIRWYTNIRNRFFDTCSCAIISEIIIHIWPFELDRSHIKSIIVDNTQSICNRICTNNIRWWTSSRLIITKDEIWGMINEISGTWELTLESHYFQYIPMHLSYHKQLSLRTHHYHYRKYRNVNHESHWWRHGWHYNWKQNIGQQLEY